MALEMREFISYASSYDVYVGRKDWSELSYIDQDRVLIALTSNYSNIEEITMSLDWKRSQELSLRAITLMPSLMLERLGIIQDLEFSDNHKHWLWTLLSETPVGHRLYEAWHSEEGEHRRTPLDSKMLDTLAPDLKQEHPIMGVTSMDWDAAVSFLEALLGSVPQISPAPHERTIFEKEWNELTVAERSLMFDAASVGNQAALKRIDAAIPMLTGFYSIRAERILRQQGTWRIRWAQKLVG